MPKNNFTEWGAIDTSTCTLEDVSAELARLWNSGEYRMRPLEIERLTGYLLRVSLAHQTLLKTVNLFHGLAARAEDEKITILYEPRKNVHKGASRVEVSA